MPLRTFSLLLCALALLAPRLEALEVQQTLWGFDGRVTAGRFSPLSVLVSNPGSAPFDGEITLAQTDGIGSRGAEFVQPAYLAPHTSRWVQFHVFIAAAGEDFTLRWGRGSKERYTLEQTTALGPPARVRLLDSDNPFAAPGALKVFPDQLFPTTVSATDSLDAVVLDYIPRWEPARRDAFLDWLKRGGVVHLLPAANGEPLVFSDVLEILNFSGDSARIGAGQAVRHTVSRRELSERYLDDKGFPARSVQKNQNPILYNFEDTLFRRLAGLTRPDINWTLINLLTLGYVVIVGPVHYRFRRRLDYRVSIAAFLGVVTLFGAAFAVVGRRGYGESQTVHSLSIARSLGGARHDVTQWISAFATSGDIYHLTHTAPANLYAAPSTSESVRGQILNGKDGQFIADIPLYSSRAFLHRAAMTGDDTSVTVEKWETSSTKLTALSLKKGSEFPKNATEAVVRCADLFYRLAIRGDALELDTAKPQLANEFLSDEKIRRLANESMFNKNDSDTAQAAALPLLYARAIDLKGVFAQSTPETSLPANRLQLYIAAPSPSGFALRGKGFTHEQGVVLYVQEIAKP